MTELNLFRLRCFKLHHIWWPYRIDFWIFNRWFERNLIKSSNRSRTGILLSKCRKFRTVLMSIWWSSNVIEFEKPQPYSFNSNVCKTQFSDSNKPNWKAGYVDGIHSAFCFGLQIQPNLKTGLWHSAVM